MLRRTMFATAVFAAATVALTAAVPAIAQSNDGKATAAMAQQGGTAQEDAACRRDTRRFCRHIKAGEGNNAFLQCLQEHRAKLSKPCDAVLKSHGL